MEHDSDAALVVAARTGDRDAFAAIYDRYSDRLHDFATSVVRDRDDAADVVQDTFLIAARRLGGLRDPERLRPWLFAIARHEAIRLGKARARAVPVGTVGERADDDHAPEAGVTAEEAARIVRDAAAGLGERDRTLLALHVREGLEGDDLARAMGVRTGTAYMMVNRLKAQVERSIGALLLARAARRDCPDLETILAGWDGSFSPLVRKRVARHADACETCADRRRTLASPLALLAAAPVLPAPSALRSRVLERVRTGAAGPTSDPPTRSDGFPRARPPWRQIGVAAVVGAVVGAGVTIGASALDDGTPAPQTAVTAPSGPPTTMHPATIEVVGAFTSYPGSPPSPPSPNRVSLVVPPHGGPVTGSSEWAVDAGGGTTTVAGTWTGTYDPGTHRLAGTVEITTTGPGGRVLGGGTASWSASYDPSTMVATGSLEGDDGRWGFRLTA